MLAADLYLALDGIQGEATGSAPQHIEIQNFSFGVSKTAGQGQNTGAGKVTVSEFHLTGASTIPPSNPISDFKLDFTHSGSTNQPPVYLKYTLDDVIVSSYQLHSGDSAPADSFSLNFTEIVFDYSPKSNNTSAGEQVRILQEKDQDITVEHDESHWVGHEPINPTGSDESITIRGQRTNTVDTNESITIHGNRDAADSDENITIHTNQSNTSGNSGLTLPLPAGDEITISTGAASITMINDGTIAIPGSDINLLGSGAFVASTDGSFTAPLMQTDATFYFFSTQPQFGSASIAPVNEGDASTLRGAIVNDLPSDPFTITVDWGDGSMPQVLPLSAGMTTFGPTHHYAHAGEFTVKLSVAADGTIVTNYVAADVMNGSGPITAHQLYVNSVYHDLLGRAPDPQGLIYWSQLLDGDWAASDVAQAIAHSDEYYMNFVIMPDYLKLLGRSADDAAAKFWTSKLDAGLTDQQFEADLVSSAEFYANAGGTNTAWIDAVYKLLLGRPADANGESFWNSQLVAGQTLNQVAQRIAGSQENNTQLINDDYFHYLGRSADADGLAYWLDQFADGKTNEDVITGFTGSAEYYNQHTS